LEKKGTLLEKEGTLLEKEGTLLRKERKFDLLAIPDCSHVCCPGQYHRPGECKSNCEGCCAWFSKDRTLAASNRLCPYQVNPDLLENRIDFDKFTKINTTKLYFNSGVMVLIPNQIVYKELLESLKASDCLRYGSCSDQDHLNHFFRGKWYPLPLSYNAQVSAKLYHDDKWPSKSLKVLHFVGDNKPWNLGRLVRLQRFLPIPIVYSEFYPVWWQIWDRLYPPSQTESIGYFKDSLKTAQILLNSKLELIKSLKESPVSTKHLPSELESDERITALSEQVMCIRALRMCTGKGEEAERAMKRSQAQRVLRRICSDSLQIVA